MRMDGGALETPSMRGFCERKTEPRAFWEVLARRSVRDEKNW
jgi:hypothetical protein